MAEQKTVDWVVPGKIVPISTTPEVNKPQGEVLEIVKPADGNSPALVRVNQVVVTGVPAPKQGK